MMNKTILMLSVSCMSFIAGADLCYAGFNLYGTPPVLSAAMLKSHVSTHTSHLTAAHLSSLEDFAELTLPENSDLSLPKALGSYLSYPLPKDLGRGWGGFHNTPLIQLAAACFVTDTTDCSGNEFAGNNADDNDGGVPPGGDDYELDDSKRCIEEGYTITDCPEDSDPINFCPYDNTYFEKCKALCPSDYVTCEPPYHGVGEACGDQYASCECTPCGSGYDNTTIPDGYVQDGEACLDCDGKTKYKIKPNPCEGYMDCGSMGPEAGANTCQSGTTTKYDNCKPCANECSMDSCPSPYTCKKEECSNKYCKNGCQSGYVWNASSKTCTCDPNKYKYTCTGANETGGSGSSCDGKYQSCRCASGYVWKNGQCVCDTSYYAYSCTGTGEIKPSGAQTCNGYYSYCQCDVNKYNGWDYRDGCECKDEYKFTCTYLNESPSGDYCQEGSRKYYKQCACAAGTHWNGAFCECDDISNKYNCEDDYSYKAEGGIGQGCYYGKKSYIYYNSCSCKDGYTWRVESGFGGECTNRLPILYSDKTQSYFCHPEKTPIGIVVEPGKAASLIVEKNIDSGKPYPNDLAGFGGKGFDVPDVPNHSDYTDTNGKANTKAFIAYGKANGISYPYVEVCYNKVTEGTSVGDWYLPGAYELTWMEKRIPLAYKSLVNNFNATINYLTAYNSLCKVDADNIVDNDDWYITSTEIDANRVWLVDPTVTMFDEWNKDSSNHSYDMNALCFLQF